MFSANENIALRQHKRRVVEYVEETIPEEALDMGTMVMVMQVQCKAPGCVPIETAIVIVFPKVGEECMEGLPESAGGSYKTKVLKPMSDVTKDDVLEVLPPQFKGGQRTMTKLCHQARDVMLAQITQLFGDGGGSDEKGNSTITQTTTKDTTLEERRLMAQYLQQSLQDYLDRNCIPPKWGEPFCERSSQKDEEGSNNTSVTKTPAATTTIEKEPTDTKQSGNSSGRSAATNSNKSMFQGTGNFVFRRPVDDYDEEDDKKTTTTTRTTLRSTSSNIIQQLERHAPGVRIEGCPCCDPENPANLISKVIGM